MKTLDEKDIGELLKGFMNDSEDLIQEESDATTACIKIFIGSVMVIGMLLFNIANSIKSLKN